MGLTHPDYWLVYLPASTEHGAKEVVALAPQWLPLQQLDEDTAFVLGMTSAYIGDGHEGERVVFFGEMTRWLADDGFEWEHFDLDIDDVLLDLDHISPALIIEASTLAMYVVANAAYRAEIMFPDGTTEPLDRHIEPARQAILTALERDWPSYIEQLLGSR